MKTKKKTAGRKAGLSAKGVTGADVWSIEHAAVFGEIALTEGGVVAFKFMSSAGYVQKFGEQDPVAVVGAAGFQKIKDRIYRAFLESDAQFFKDVAQALASYNAFRSRGRRGPQDTEALSLAAYFTGFCDGKKYNVRALWTEAEIAQRFPGKTLLAAWKRAPFTPTTSELHQFLQDMMEDPPDVSTVRRIAKTLGLPSSPRGRPKTRI